MYRPLRLLFVTFLHWAFVRADYTIDDSNYSVLKFSENPAGPVWGPFGSDTGEVLEIRLPNGTMQTVDATQCYDGTYTYAACSASNNCAVQFSFTGSGLTIYVLQAGPQGMSASLSIDSGTSTTATLGAPPPPQYYIPHVTLFNVQNIPSGTHTAVMKVLDWNGGFSGMMLDYVDVNQAQVASPTTSPSSSPAPSSTPAQSASSTAAATPTGSNPQTSSQQTTLTESHTSTGASETILSVRSSQLSGTTALPSSTSSGNVTGSTDSSSLASKKTNIAAIVGGVVGGVVGLLALLALALLCFWRRRRQQAQESHERPSPLLLPQPETRLTNFDVVGGDPFSSSTGLPMSQTPGHSRPLQSWTDSEADSTPNATAQDASNPSRVASSSSMHVTSSGNDSATSSVPVSTGTAAVAAGAAAAAAIPRGQDASTPALISHPNEKSGPVPQAASGDAPGAHPSAVLTDSQADFVNGLFNNNVPAPVVARVLERMLANPQGAGSGYNDPELRSHLDPASSATLSLTRIPAGGVAWQPTMSDIGDEETGIGTAPPSYDYAQAQ